MTKTEMRQGEVCKLMVAGVDPAARGQRACPPLIILHRR